MGFRSRVQIPPSRLSEDQASRCLLAWGFFHPLPRAADVALEALRDCWRYRAVCRVTNVMRPYREAVAAEEGRA